MMCSVAVPLIGLVLLPFVDESDSILLFCEDHPSLPVSADASLCSDTCKPSATAGHGSNLLCTGWGGPPRPVEMPPARARGGRGGRGRRGRGRGNRRGGRSGRRGSRGFDDDGSGSESDFPASLQGDAAAIDGLGGPTAPPVKLAVEQIYGWRWPAREEESPLK